MKRIREIWPEFTPDEALEREYVYHDAWDAPIAVSGLVPDDDREYCRLPRDLVGRVNDGVAVLAWHTAGACVRFATDAPSLCVAAALRGPELMNHMAVSGQSGADLYLEGDEGWRRVGPIRPDIRPEGAGIRPWLSLKAVLPGEGMRTCCLYLPLYNGVKKLLIGLPAGARLEAPRARRYEAPVVFYGSSITQGGCASNAGSCFSAILGRRLDANVYNLGFSGSARGEDSIAAYIASLKMSAFVLDYDHNAPSVEHLMNTHEKLFKTVRAAQKDLPVVIVSKPDFDTNPEDAARRRAVVRRTWENARAAGDDRVWFVDGETLFGTTDRELCTVDGCHPNTLGFLRMADAIEPALREALNAAK